MRYKTASTAVWRHWLPKREGTSFAGRTAKLLWMLFQSMIADYIMPPMPAPPIGIAGAGFSSFLSAITHSVVRNIPATEAAF